MNIVCKIWICFWLYLNLYAYEFIWTCIYVNLSFQMLVSIVFIVCEYMNILLIVFLCKLFVWCFHYLLIYEYVLIVYVWILFVKIWICFWLYLKLYAYECIILSVVFVCFVCVLFSLFVNTRIYFLLYLYVNCVCCANIWICFDCICMNIVCKNMNMFFIVSKLVCLWIYLNLYICEFIISNDCECCFHCLWIHEYILLILFVCKLFVCCFHDLLIYAYVLIVYVWILIVKIWILWMYHFEWSICMYCLYVVLIICEYMNIFFIVFVCKMCVLFSLFANI